MSQTGNNGRKMLTEGVFPLILKTERTERKDAPAVKQKEKRAGAPGAPQPGYDAAEEKAANVIGRRIAEARKQKGLSLAAFSRNLERFGVKISTGGAGKWETGASVPNAYQLIAVCRALEIEDPLPFFMSGYVPALNGEGERRVREYRADLIACGRYAPVPKIIRAAAYVDMPVSDLCVSAGTGAFLDEGGFDMVSFPADKVPRGADFGVRVSGDSMEPVYHDGQIVWVQECGELAVGQVGVFLYDGEGYLKVYSEREPAAEDAEVYTDSGGVVHPQPVLRSYNEKYAPKPIRPEALFRIVGRVL